MSGIKVLFVQRTKVAIHDSRNFRLIDQFGDSALIIFIHACMIPELLNHVR